MRAEQAFLFQVPEHHLHAVVFEGFGLQCLREFQHGGHTRSVVGGAMADGDLVVVRADQQQGRLVGTAEVGDEVLAGLAIAFECFALPGDAERTEAPGDGVATPGRVAVRADRFDLAVPAAGHVVGPGRHAGEHGKEQGAAQAAADVTHGGTPYDDGARSGTRGEAPSMPQGAPGLDGCTRM